MDQKFSIGEYVTRRMDGEVGVVRGTETYNGGVLYRVELLRHEYDLDDNMVIGSEQAWTRFFRMHAHMESHSRDCDGDYTRGLIYEMTLAEHTDQLGDLQFKKRVVANILSLHGYGELGVTPEGVEWNETTEEGFRHVTVRWCEDECPSERSWQRDHRAEEMGY